MLSLESGGYGCEKCSEKFKSIYLQKMPSEKEQLDKLGNFIEEEDEYWY